MDISNLRVSLIRKVKPPCRANKADAGIDFFVPEDLSFNVYQCKNPHAVLATAYNESQNETHFVELEYNDINSRYYISEILIHPNERALIPSGVKADIQFGWALVQYEKSGIWINRGLKCGGCVIDSGYQGEIHISVFNASNEVVAIKAGDKLVQFLLLPVGLCDIEVVPDDVLYDKTSISSRGDRGFGSTNTI